MCRHPGLRLRHSHYFTRPRPAQKLQTALDTTASKPNDLGLAGILPIAHLIRGDIAKYILRTATKPDPVQITSKIQESLNKDPRVHINRSWAMKAAVIQRDTEIPAIHPPDTREIAPWCDCP